MIEGRGSGTGKLIRAENFDGVACAGGKLTRWRCSEYSAGTSRLIIEVDNRNTNRLGNRAYKIPITVNTDVLK
ncbi:hypothetical protein [Cohnella silvisoli]|uniref:hypothetical protein n=1 Tax=Cohnella silvisoli TaxID=2873699 RepID=UPI001E3E3B53|nr:hypothetical protein [Cohnella silvisoli]MCD9025694.1 hypothetical protein [Cohnella silvisoli]